MSIADWLFGKKEPKLSSKEAAHLKQQANALSDGGQVLCIGWRKAFWDHTDPGRYDWLPDVLVEDQKGEMHCYRRSWGDDWNSWNELAKNRDYKVFGDTGIQICVGFEHATGGNIDAIYFSRLVTGYAGHITALPIEECI